MRASNSAHSLADRRRSEADSPAAPRTARARLSPAITLRLVVPIITIAFPWTAGPIPRPHTDPTTSAPPQSTQ